MEGSEAAVSQGLAKDVTFDYTDEKIRRTHLLVSAKNDCI